MSLAAFTFTARARPIVQIGLGDSRVPTGTGRWNTSKWDESSATWAGTEPSWFDVTCDVESADIIIGRERVTERFIVGTCAVIVNNASGWADPALPPGGPTTVVMRPGRAIRVGVEHVTLGRCWLFRGIVDEVDPTYQPIDDDTVRFQCVDVLGDVNRAKLKPLDAPVGANEWASERVHRILDAAQWWPSKRDVHSTHIALVQTDLGGQVADMLGVAADSAGGVVFGDLDGNICFRPIDWQVFPPSEPVDGTIGNVGKGEPGYIIPGAPGYLTPTIGTVTTPDPGPLPVECVFVAKVRGPAIAAANKVIACQFETNPPGQASWLLRRNATSGYGVMTIYPTGATTPASTRTGPTTGSAIAITGADECLAFAFVAGPTSSLTHLRSLDDGATWETIGTGPTGPAVVPFDSNTVARIGAYAITGDPWTGRIYSVELRTGLNPAAGEVLWRFDANDYPGTGTSYTDPRGRAWTLTNASAITPKVPDVIVPAVPSDVCPIEWSRPFRRADIATRVLVGRDGAVLVQVDDTTAQITYGIEPFERTDLQTANTVDLDMIARRLLEVRSASTAPRVRSVTINAATAQNALDLLCSINVYEPSRYRCRLAADRGLVFDDDHFATGVHHVITPDRWQADINLDLAQQWEAIRGRWDQERWSQTVWADAAQQLLRHARALRDEIGAVA